MDIFGKTFFFTLKKYSVLQLPLYYGRYIKFYIQIGGESLKKGCGQPRHSEDVIILQYSTDAGIAKRNNTRVFI